MSRLADMVSPEYRELVSEASLDWQVAQYVRFDRIRHEHSANEIKAEFIAQVGFAHHGEAFRQAVERYCM